MDDCEQAESQPAQQKTEVRVYGLSCRREDAPVDTTAVGDARSEVLNAWSCWGYESDLSWRSMLSSLPAFSTCGL